MSITAIESVLQQMRAINTGREWLPSASAPLESDGGFAGALRQSLDRISQSQQHAYRQAEAFELGAPGVSLNDVMVDLQKANIGLQMGLQVRNRVVAAYQEVMNIQS